MTAVRSTQVEFDPDTVALIQSLTADPGKALDTIANILLSLRVPELLTTDNLTAGDPKSSPRAAITARIINTVNEQTLAIQRIQQILVALTQATTKVSRHL